jgi:hypothetical protein
MAVQDGLLAVPAEEVMAQSQFRQKMEGTELPILAVEEAVDRNHPR